MGEHAAPPDHHSLATRRLVLRTNGRIDTRPRHELDDHAGMPGRVIAGQDLCRDDQIHLAPTGEPKTRPQSSHVNEGGSTVSRIPLCIRGQAEPVE